MRKSYFISASIALIIGIIWGANILLLYNQSIRLDESQSIWYATKSISGILSTVAADVHVPLYMLLLHYWMKIFGTDIVFVRTLSLIFFIGTLPVIYKLAKESSNNKVANLSVILFSLSPFILWFSSEARMYSLFTLITCINHLYFTRLLRSFGKEGKGGYLLSTIIGFYTHYFFILLIVSQIAYLVGRKFITSQNEYKMSLGKTSRVILADVCIAFIFFMPWIIFAVGNGIGIQTAPLIHPPSTYNIFQTLLTFFFGFQTNSVQSVIISLWPLSVIGLFLLFTQRRKTDFKNLSYFTSISFVPIFLAFIISFIRPLFVSRYLIFVTPTMFILLGWIIGNASKRFSMRSTFITLMAMIVLLFHQNISQSVSVKENYQGVSEYLKRNTTTKDIIAVSAPFTVYPIEYTYLGPSKITTIPEWNRYLQGPIPQFSYKSLYHQIEDMRKLYKKLYVVYSYNQGYEKNVKDYLDEHTISEGTIEFSPGLELRIYDLRKSRTSLVGNSESRGANYSKD